MISQSRRGWIVLWAAVILNFFIGLGYIWSIIAKQLIEQLHWTSVQASLPYTVFSIMFAVSMMLSGPIQDRKGPRFSSTLGGLLIGGGLILTGFALKPSLMVLTFGLITGTGLGSMYSATVPPALKWFPPEKKGTINGAIVAVLALASIMYSPVAKTLMENMGIAPTFWIIGGVLIVILTGTSQLLCNPPEGYQFASESGSPAAVTAVVEQGPREMLKSGDFYKIWFMFALSASSSLMVVGHIANIAKSQAGWNGGFILVILLALCNGAGRFFLGGYLSDKLGRGNLMRLTFILQAVNMLLFMFYRSPLLLIIGVAVAGLCYGSTMVVFSAATADKWGMKNFGANYGIVFMAWGLAGVVGPLPSAFIFDATGSYTGAFLISGVLVIVSLILAFTYKASDKG